MGTSKPWVVATIGLLTILAVPVFALASSTLGVPTEVSLPLLVLAAWHFARSGRAVDGSTAPVTRLSDVGPWFSHTRVGRWKDRISIALVVAILLLCLWKSFY